MVAAGGWRREAGDLVRGVSGGLLFGVPLLYTMEVWWYGSWVDPRWMLGALVLAFVAVLALMRSAGFRDTRVTSWSDAVGDGVEILAVALVSAAAFLVLLRQVTWETSLEAAVGATVFEAIPFAFGAALARQFLQRVDADDDGDPADDMPVDDPAIGRTLADAGGAAVGALVVSFSIAPTDEVPMIAQSLSAPWLIAMVLASLAASYAIVFAADFLDQEGRRRHEGLFQRPFAETVGAYAIALVVALVALLAFERVGPDHSWESWVAFTLVLGLPAAIGGAAGRLAV